MMISGPTVTLTTQPGSPEPRGMLDLPPAEVAKCAGTSLWELQWFTSKKAPLARHTHFDREDLLGIEYHETMGGCVSSCANHCILPEGSSRAQDHTTEPQVISMVRVCDIYPFAVFPSITLLVVR
jgi:hypothetical protein